MSASGPIRALGHRPDLAAYFAISRRADSTPWNARRTPPMGGVLVELEALRRKECARAS